MIYTVTPNPAIDYVVGLNPPLHPGAVNRCDSESFYYGGKGINVSSILARLGVPSIALGFIAGQTGRWLTELVAQDGIRSDFISLPAGMTRVNVKLRAGQSSVLQETELNGRGPALTPEAIAALDKKLDALTAGDLLVLAGSLPAGLSTDNYRRQLMRLRDRHVDFVLDTSGRGLTDALPCRPLLIKPNRSELEEIVGRPLPDDAALLQAAAALQQAGARNVLVSLAADGALLLDETGRAHRAPAPTGRPCNSVGAGDSMVAGFVAGWLQTGDYDAALRLGIACGSATAFCEGLARKADIEAALARI